MPTAPVTLPAAPSLAPAYIVPPPPMPTWAAAPGPSAQKVQQQYVDTRLEEMEANRKPGKKAALDVLEELLAQKVPRSRWSRIRKKELLRIYDSIERNLQAADLTINFMSEAWFAAANPYDTYTQMYQRAVGDQGMVLKDTPQNQADLRAMVDNAVTFPQGWQNAQGSAQRGLSVGMQSPDRIQRQMDTGKLISVQAPGQRLGEFVAGNRYFNPNTKQIFLALNYGRRPFGSAINYGYSHFVIKSKLKSKCLYYAQDTFIHGKKTPKGKKIRVDAANIQFAYDNLGALLYANGDAHLQEAIFDSCYSGQILKDPISTVCSKYLVEAHHFGELSFRNDVEYMVISPRGISDLSLWPAVVQNAHDFCSRNNIKLYQA